MYKTLISVNELNAQLNDKLFLIVDCRFNLADTEEGRASYKKSHLPRAIYAHLGEDLSGEIVKGKTGRHPLPNIDDLNHLFSSWGITKNTQVIAYDDAAGPFAARLWWMLRWAGHEKVAVLNGGFKQWCENKMLLETHPSSLNSTSEFVAKINIDMLVDANYVLTHCVLENNHICLLDARPGDRYCGQNETMDAKAGHIPGAISLPFFNNLTETGCFKERDDLLVNYQDKMQGIVSKNTIVYCGSGVTAAHNLLAMEICGLTGAKNYAGSWSDWINDDRPIEVC